MPLRPAGFFTPDSSGINPNPQSDRARQSCTPAQPLLCVIRKEQLGTHDCENFERAALSAGETFAYYAKVEDGKPATGSGIGSGFRIELMHDSGRSGAVSRIKCYRCFWPQSLCWCSSIQPMATRTRFVFLMHPKEFKHEKAGTGRLTHLCLPNSEIRMGKTFDDHEDVQALIDDPGNYCVLLYPGQDALNLSRPSDLQLSTFNLQLRERRLVVFLIDATWSGARKMLRLSPSLQRLPRIMFTPSAPSRFIIKQQPQAGCLSTLEATHELLIVLERLGLDGYPLPEQLLGIFAKMQEIQMRCAADPARGGYRRKPYSAPVDRARPRGKSGTRRGYMKTGKLSA
jgi:DTW domain-containing protein YfiP